MKIRILLGTILTVSVQLAIGAPNTPTTLIAPSSSQTSIKPISQSDISNGQTHPIKVPGYYQVSRELTFSPDSTGDTIINIITDDVNLDLGGFRIFSDKSNTGTVCINIAAGLQNINIFNGTINAMTGKGINIGSGCRNIHIANVTIHDCVEGGIVADSSDHIYLSNCLINNCSGTSTLGNAAALRLTSCKHMYASNCEFSQNVGSAIPSIGALLSACVSCEFDNCFACHNGSTSSGTNAYGFQLTSGSHDCLFQDCGSTSLNAAAGEASGFNVSDSSGNRFIRCHSNNNTAVGGACNAFKTDTTSKANVFESCVALSNTSDTNMYAFHLQGNGNQLELCKAKQNTATTAGDAVGYFVDGTGASNTGSSNIFRKCMANQNTASAGNASGFQLKTARSNSFDRCTSNNNETSAQSKYAAGFDSTAGTNNLFKDCTANNQYCSNATGGTTAGTAEQYAAGFLMQSTEKCSRIIGCNASCNDGGAGHGIGFGIYLRGDGILTNLADTSGPTNMMVKDCTMEFNTSIGSGSNQTNRYGFFDEHKDTTTALINNISTGHGRCVATLDTSQNLVDPIGSSSLVNGMNFFFRASGSDENPANMIHETDIFNWTTLSTSVANWMNVSIVIEQVTTIDGGVSI